MFVPALAGLLRTTLLLSSWSFGSRVVELEKPQNQLQPLRAQEYRMIYGTPPLGTPHNPAHIYCGLDWYATPRQATNPPTRGYHLIMAERMARLPREQSTTGGAGESPQQNMESEQLQMRAKWNPACRSTEAG